MKTQYDLECVEVVDHGHLATVKFRRGLHTAELYVMAGDLLPVVGEVWVLHAQRRASDTPETLEVARIAGLVPDDESRSKVD